MTNRIVITLEITDPETVESYQDVDNVLIMDDLTHGTLMFYTKLVDRKNEIENDHIADTGKMEERK